MGRVLDAALPRTGLRDVLRTAEPVAWHAHRNGELALGLLLRLLRRHLKVIWTRHAATPPSGMTRLLARFADAVVALTPEVARLLPVPSNVVGHGVDLQRFQPPVHRAASWNALDVGGRYGLGVVGRVRPAKGQQTLAEALRTFETWPGEWLGVLVGRVQPADRSFAEGLAAPYLKLVGEQQDVTPWYRGLSILVQPSYSEGFGLTVVEGMASACCVVASRIADVPSLIEHGRTGFLFAPGDAKELGALLEPLLREPARAEAIGRAAAEEARFRFSIEREAEALVAVYRRALGD
ncbi:MAG: hypothetical protein RL199_1017 [Pseudomonadota bacterium]